MADRRRDRASGSTAPPTRATDDHAADRTEDHTAKEALIGTDRRARVANTSWGAVFAGVVTFLAIVVLLSLVTAAIGLGGASGTAAGIWSAVSVALGLAAAGYVAGALAVRGGLLHGFLTWATSVVAAVVLVAWLGASLLGALGGVLGQVAAGATELAAGEDLGQLAEDVEEAVDQEDVDQAEEQAQQALDDAQQAADEAADDASTAAWWAFAGLLIGAVIASAMGAVGAKSVVTPDEVQRTR
jgi:hypothetical protein